MKSRLDQVRVLNQCHQLLDNVILYKRNKRKKKSKKTNSS